MAMNVNNSNMHEAIQVISERGFDGMEDALRVIFNQVMLVERERYLQARLYQHTDARVDRANGFKPKTLNTRLEAFDVFIPQTHEIEF